MYTGKRTTPKALQTKEHDEKTNNGVGESSFRVLYYGSASAGSVPFMWESQPGTPKHALTESSLPPLTPPPSYYQFSQKYNSPMHVINHHHSPKKRSGFFRTIFLNSSKPNAPPHPSSLSSGSVSSSSSLSWRSTPVKFGFADDGGSPEHAAEDGGSPTSTLCFGGGFKRSYTVRRMKKPMLWFVRNGKA